MKQKYLNVFFHINSEIFRQKEHEQEGAVMCYVSTLQSEHTNPDHCFFPDKIADKDSTF